MNHLIFLDLFRLEVRDVEGPHRLERGQDRMVERPAAIGNAQVLADLPQRPEDAGPSKRCPWQCSQKLMVSIFPRSPRWPHSAPPAPRPSVSRAQLVDRPVVDITPS